MHRKARSILRGEQGLSMILVLCIGALFVALSAALVYAASVLTANANRQLLEQEAYQLATSYSDVLEQELNDRTSSFATFVNEVYMTSEGYGYPIYESQSNPTEFAWDGAGASVDGADSITITLRRRPGEDVDGLTHTADNCATATELLNQIVPLEGGIERKGIGIKDLQLDVTVTVKKSGEKFSYTRTYDRTVRYDSDGSKADKGILPQIYYTFGEGTTKYYRLDDLTFWAAGMPLEKITDANVANTKLTFHCDIRQIPESITYTRGVKQNTDSTTQE